MEKAWIYDKEPSTSYEKGVYKSLLKITKNEDLAEKGAKNLGLFDFLKKSKFSSADELYNSVFLDSAKKEHFFSKEDSRKVFDFFSFKGGADETAYDALIDRWVNFMFYLTPQVIQQQLTFLGEFAFPLRSLEDETLVPGAGPALGFAVDVVAQGNKIAAKLAQQYTPMIMGIMPIPEASTVGIVIGYMISTMFIFFNMLIFVTRHHFGEAFTQSLALFPFVGLALQNFAESGDKLVEKFAAKRTKLISDLKSGMFSPLGDLVENWTFDPMNPGDAKERAEKFKAKIQEHIENVKNATKDFSDPIKRQQLLDSAKAKYDELKANPQVQNLQNKLQQVRDLPQVQRNIESARSTFSNLKQRFQGQQAGKRLSRRKHVKGKWATQRRYVK